ncbi:MAG: hypothetical protein ABJA62_02345 [Luteimonas sp.]
MRVVAFGLGLIALSTIIVPAHERANKAVSTISETRLPAERTGQGNHRARLTVSATASDRKPPPIFSPGSGAQSGRTYPPIAPGENVIDLPVEVLGPQGTAKSVSFYLPDATGATSIYLRCHACGYDDADLDKDNSRAKATVSINGGSAIALKHYTGDGMLHGNAMINVMEPENSYGGIGGGFRTVRFTLPATGIHTGRNTLTFVHARPDNRSIGFRIVDLTVRRGNTDLIPASDRLMVSRHHLTPTLLLRSDIQAGRALWFGAALYDPYVDSLDGTADGGAISGSIQASCSDCHARDGRDLHYFGYSDEAIIARSKFHRLSSAQGRKIATYIDSLNVPGPASAHPWNPPYQPGPGTDAKPVSAWAAGAGVDAVLSSDAEINPFLFPQGTNLASVTAVVDRFSTLNIRELPIGLQLPDWNTWLPRIHPKDLFNSAATVVLTDDRGQITYAQPYYQVLYDRARMRGDSQGLNDLIAGSGRWLSRGAACFSLGGDGANFRAIDSDVMVQGLALAGASDFATGKCASYRHDANKMWGVEAAKRGLAAWLSVKQWEIVQEHGLETESQRLGTNVCAGRCINASEARGWGTSEQNVFFRAAHFTGFDSARFRDENELVSTYGTTVWYQLQLTINPGYRVSQPSHFPYVSHWIEELQTQSNQNQAFRFWADMIKMRQLQTNGAYGVENGLDLRTAQPVFLYSNFGAQTRPRSDVGAILWRSLVTAQLKDFLDDVVRASPQDWADANQNRVVQSPDSVLFPCNAACFASRSPTPFLAGPYQGQNTFRVVQKLRSDVGVPESILSKLINWGEGMWPNAPWSSLCDSAELSNGTCH